MIPNPHDPIFSSKVQKYLHRILSRHTFVRADLFKELLKLNIAISDEKLKKGRVNYTIWTALSYEVPIKQESINVTREISKAVNTLTGGYGQTFSYPDQQPSFDNGILMVMGIPVTINTAIARGDICNALVKADEHVLSFDELWEEIGNRDTRKTQELFKYFYPKVRHFNQFINSKLGFKDYLFIKDGKIGINRLYLPQK